MINIFMVKVAKGGREAGRREEEDIRGHYLRGELDAGMNTKPAAAPLPVRFHPSRASISCNK